MSPGSLEPNTEHPFRDETPELRRQGMLRTLVLGLRAARRRRQKLADDAAEAGGNGVASDAGS